MDLFLARRVYDDCCEAAEEFTALHFEALNDNHSLFRRRYLTFVVLARAVGHILHKVEAYKSPQHAAAIAEAWKTIKQEPLFIHFIEQDRNSLIKQYSAIAEMNYREWIEHITNETGTIDRQLLSKLSFPVKHGFYQGKDLRDLGQEVVAFWGMWLSVIEQRIDELNQAESS